MMIERGPVHVFLDRPGLNGEVLTETKNYRVGNLSQLIVTA